MSLESSEMAWLAAEDGTFTVGHGPFTTSTQPPEQGIAFFLQDFSLSRPSPWSIPARHEHIAAEDMPSASSAYPDLSWYAPDADRFAGVFQEIMTAIRQGEFEKTVPVVTEKGISPIHPADFLRDAMWHRRPPLFSYGWQTAHEGFAGATPELLLSLDQTRLTTMALAGTARSEDSDVFAVDEKEIREHEYVAQTLVAKLMDFGILERRPREILPLGSIVHFLTRLTVDLRQSLSPEEWIRKLHPTPALGSLPRTPATLSRLLNWRSRLDCPPTFGAPFGVLENGHFRAVVAIRGVWWQDQNLQIPAGCGIIEASRLVNEWRELRLKREAVKAFIAK